MRTKLLWVLCTLGILWAGQASAAEPVFEPEPYGGDWSYWLFKVSHTDPATRLTRIDVTNLPLRMALGTDEFFSYFFSFLFPTWVPGSTETEDGYLAQSYGWQLGGATNTSFWLVHDRGFRGAADLYMFDSNAFHNDFDPLRAELHLGTVTFTTVTPEPLSVLLLGTGLAGIAAVARRRSRRT